MTGYSWGGITMGIIVVVLVLVVVVALFRKGQNGRSGRGNSGNRGLEILEERFARGEITPEQFRSMKGELLSGGK